MWLQNWAGVEQTASPVSKNFVFLILYQVITFYFMLLQFPNLFFFFKMSVIQNILSPTMQQ